MSVVELSQGLHAYFQGQISRALRSLALSVAASTEVYLADLLATVSERAEALSTPFVELLAQALTVEGRAAQLARMRLIGDSALVVAGFFADSLPARGVSQGYVVSIGSRAYRTAAGAQDLEAHVLGDLATRFPCFVRVFDEVREQTSLCTDADLVRLYERWRQSGSTAVHDRLVRRGVNPVKTPVGSH